jgi:hypothetical protein
MPHGKRHAGNRNLNLNRSTMLSWIVSALGITVDEVDIAEAVRTMSNVEVTVRLQTAFVVEVGG